LDKIGLASMAPSLNVELGSMKLLKANQKARISVALSRRTNFETGGKSTLASEDVNPK